MMKKNQYKDGKKDGYWEYYHYYNGQISYKGNYKDGKLHHLYKIQRHNKYIYEEHIRMERYDKAGIVKDKIKSNNEIIDILNNLNQNKDE